MLRYMQFLRENSMFEILTIFFLAMASFVIAESFRLAGVVAVLACGIICNKYAWFNLSDISKVSSSHFFMAIGSTMEFITFVLMGVSVFYFINDKVK